MRFLKIVPILLVALIAGVFLRPLVDKVSHFIAKPAAESWGPDLELLYNRNAGHDSPRRNPVVFIPGYMGSRLVRDSDKLIAWGAFDNTSINANVPEEARVLAIPMKKGASLSELVDDVQSDGVLNSLPINISGFKTVHKAYEGIARIFGSGKNQDIAKLDCGTSCYFNYQFDYDWRRDNVENAQRLHEFLLQKKALVQAERIRRFGAESREVKFDIVTHSMGGLIARYYMRYGDQPLENAQLNWAGGDLVERVLMIAPPNLGSLKSIIGATDGFRAHGLLPKHQGALLSSFPSTFQLFPRDHHEIVVSTNGQPLAVYDADTWRTQQWGFFSPQNAESLAAMLPEVDSVKEREEIAFDHIEKCLRRAELFHQALDSKAEPPEGVEFYLFAGDSIDTPSKIAALPPSTKNESRFEVVSWSPGDDTVSRSSALGDERTEEDWEPKVVSPIKYTGAYFIFKNHFDLTKDSVFIDNALHILFEKPRIELDDSLVLKPH